MIKKIILGVVGLVLLAGIGLVFWMGPRNVIGMIMYDQRREGDLVVGDQAPDVPMINLAGEESQFWSALSAEKPTVLIFGSFT